MAEEHELDPTQNTRDWIETKFASLRSEMRMLFVMAVAGNQLLTHISLTPTIGYISSGAIIAGAVTVKVLLLR